MRLTRRDFIRTGAAATSLAAISSPLALADSPAGTIPIGMQLYAVRGACGKDFPGTLEALAKMGYQGVEFYGYSGRSADHRGRSPKELRKLLDDNGLKCCGTHLRTRINTLADGYDEFDKEVEFNQVLGNPYLLFPWMPDEMRNTEEACKKTAALLDTLAERIKKVDAYVGYHAHGGDFAKIGDSTQWDLLFGNSCDRVIMQMDIGNCIGGGGDPYATLKRFPGRSLTVHLKEHGGDAKAALGEGEVDWKKVFRVCEANGGTKWYIVEHESGDDPLVSVAACLENLREMGK